ncbi:putative cysteine-rich receptor-like protein kinase 23 [Rosa chinensis]|uniref:putative cysteine-rich receptor-like protein kinase 23 n=1 Tax=Rosa chinensis TaxID=74649 RepID=UPI001AD8AEAE|nr:putative cysteine-rich receptor-like protein kinase 23 [Rosa chinensis]
MSVTETKKSTTNNTDFYNAISGRTLNDAVYGLFLNLDDVNTTACKSYVITVTSEVVQRCPIEKEVVIWYDDCMLCYSNKYFFSVTAESSRLFMWNTANISSELNRFNQVLVASMKQMAMAALNNSDKFTTREANFTGLISLYILG